ncbi:odorant receptor 13a isoform X2 [Ooceraea biroi]|nr:odorant receptor 13a isoform X2 [Ooceraea biroi]
MVMCVRKRVTLKQVISIVKLSVLFIWFWPLPQSSSKWKVLSMKLYQYSSILFAITVMAPMLYSVMNNLDDSNHIIKSLFALFPCCHVIWNILCHIVIYQQLQFVTFEMERFCALIKSHEEACIQREYVDKCAHFYGFCIVVFYMSLFALILGPVVLDQPFPVTAEFPFDASRQPLRIITYLHQVVVGLQIAAHLCVNAYMALLLWVTSARFRLLTEEIRAATNIYDFIKCIKKHQQLLQYTGKVVFTVRPFALGTIMSSTISVIIFGLLLITRGPVVLKIQCLFLASCALLEVFMYAWPAEHLIQISSDIAQTTFEMKWYESEHFRKNLQMIIIRSQKPIRIVLPCGFSSLSFRYYASYLSTIFSYFTTMRIMFEKQKDGV